MIKPLSPTPLSGEILIEDARMARREQQASQVASHLRQTFSRLKSRAPKRPDGTT